MSEIEIENPAKGSEEYKRQTTAYIKEHMERLKGGGLNPSEATHLREIFNRKFAEFGKHGEWGNVENETIAEFLHFVAGIDWDMYNRIRKNQLTKEQIKVLWAKYERESENL